MLFDQVRTALRDYGVSGSTPAKDLVTPRLHSFDLADADAQQRIRNLETREWAAATLKLAGSLPDVTYAAISPAHTAWTPRGMLFWNLARPKLADHRLIFLVAGWSEHRGFAVFQKQSPIAEGQLVGSLGFRSGDDFRRNLGGWIVHRSRCALRHSCMDTARPLWRHVVCTRRIYVAGICHSVALAQATRIPVR
jgi:hypothetical protein